MRPPQSCDMYSPVPLSSPTVNLKPGPVPAMTHGLTPGCVRHTPPPPTGVSMHVTSVSSFQVVAMKQSVRRSLLSRDFSYKEWHTSGLPGPVCHPRRPGPVQCVVRSSVTSCIWLGTREHVTSRNCTGVKREGNSYMTAQSFTRSNTLEGNFSEAMGTEPGS